MNKITKYVITNWHCLEIVCIVPPNLEPTSLLTAHHCLQFVNLFRVLILKFRLAKTNKQKHQKCITSCQILQEYTYYFKPVKITK